MNNDSKSPGQLVRSLGLVSVFFLVVSSVIGSGVYKKVAPMAEAMQSPSLVLLAWTLGGVLTLFGTLSNAEVASMLADSGGEFVYYKTIYNRFFAFLYGWANFTAIRSASIASIAYVFSQSFNALVPLPVLPASLSSITVVGFLTPFDNFGVKVMTILLIIVLTYINYLGLKTGGGFSKAIVYAVITTIFGIVILGFLIGDGSWHNISGHASGYMPRSWTDSIFIKNLFAALLGSFWAYEGWSTIGYLGGEIKDAQRNLPLGLIFGMLFVIAVYLSINFTYLYVMPIDQLLADSKSTNTIAAVTVMQHLLGNGGALFMSLLILFTTLGATNTTILAAPRLYFAMAKDGLFFKPAAEIHPKYNTPGKAFVFQAVIVSLLVISGSFDQLTDMLIFASFIFYGATALGVFVLRVKMPNAPRPYKAWGYPIVPGIFVVFCVALLIITLASKPREATMGLVLIMTGIPFYFYWSKKNSS
ncbi:MAG TPA: amino acid permease [Cyclobacteriaceae bacterium]|nr:amino acid permease [Cyclobacteriaceae bacterium]